MAEARITKRIIDALEIRSSDYVHWDSELTGFGVRVRPSGAKSYIVMYRAGGRNTLARKVTIGATDKLEIDKARKAAKELLASAELGQDPAGERAKARAEINIKALCELYLEEGCDTKKASTIATDKGRIERHILPLLGNKRLGEVTQANISKFLRDVANGKTATDVKTKKRGRAIVAGGKGTATRTVGLLGGIFSFAVARRFIKENPVRGVKRYQDKKGETFLSVAQFANLGQAIASLEAGEANPSAIAIIRLLAFTGARKSEILKLKWQEVDLQRGFLALGDSKTGAKIIPLGAPALEVLAGVPQIEGSDFVFPASTGASHFQGVEKIWRKARVAAGFPKLDGSINAI